MAEPFAAADREALSQALVEHGDRLYALALRVTRDPDLAGDAVQEAFATALQRIGAFRGESSLGTWLHRIVYNKAIDLLRHRGRQAPLPDEETAGGAEDERLASLPAWARPPDQLLYGAETRRALDEALGRLTPQQRAVFTLREMEGLTTDEVASVLELEPGAVRVHLHRARLRLRSLLGEHFKGGMVAS
ncbi:MAG TPA: RNA polymerase sigma factor [Vicinamibacteria bacterium]|nr:RNA polymerase sigma factor [Vicinamibacteria bacterium]